MIVPLRREPFSRPENTPSHLSSHPIVPMSFSRLVYEGFHFLQLHLWIARAGKLRFVVCPRPRPLQNYEAGEGNFLISPRPPFPARRKERGRRAKSNNGKILTCKFLPPPLPLFFSPFSSALAPKKLPIIKSIWGRRGNDRCGGGLCTFALDARCL